jgi:hypothetical protein
MVSIDGILKLWVKWIPKPWVEWFYNKGFNIWDSKTMGWMTIVSIDGILKVWVKRQ